MFSHRVHVLKSKVTCSHIGETPVTLPVNPQNLASFRLMSWVYQIEYIYPAEAVLRFARP